MDSNSIAYLGVKCPTELPIEHRGNCFYNNGTGNCEICLFPEFRQKLEDDAHDWREMVHTMREEYRKVGGVR